MSFHRIFSFLVVPICAGLLLTACGGGEPPSQINHSVTKGQELLDLKQAYDKGVLTEREYTDQREIILERND